MEPAEESRDDPFPREQAVELVRRLPAYARLALAISRDTSLPTARRAALVGAGAYVASPVSLIPGFVPLLGQLDDLWVLLRAIRYALDGLSPDSREAHLDAASITEQDIDADSSSVNQLVAWSARRGRSTVIRAAAGSRSLGRRLSREASRLQQSVIDRFRQTEPSDRLDT